MWIERPLGTKVWEGAGYIADLRCVSGWRAARVFPPPQIWTVRDDCPRSTRTRLTSVLTPTKPGYSLAWTPDGKRLRFTATDQSGTNLSSVSLRGDVRLLVPLPGAEVPSRHRPRRHDALLRLDRVKHIALKRPGQPSQRELAWLGPFPGIANLSLDGRTLLSWTGIQPTSTPCSERPSGTPPKLLGAGLPLALSPDGRRVAMTSRDQHGLFLVPTGAGTTEEVPLSSLVVGSGQWSRDGHRLSIVAPSERPGQVPTLPSRRGDPEAARADPRQRHPPNGNRDFSGRSRWIAAPGAAWS